MKVTVLIDNKAPEGMLCEWGLSFFITFAGKNYLLDMGTTGDFAKNAQQLGIDLDTADYSVLSHAHYDHSDGMPSFFARNSRAKLFIREGAGENCYGLNDEGKLHYIGIREGLLSEYADRIVYAQGDFRIEKGVWLIPHKSSGLEQIGRKVGMKILTGNGWVTDTFQHEQSLVFQTNRGLVIFNSCSHAGPDNIIREVCGTFPGEHICAYFGGLHQFRASEEEVRNLAYLLKDLEVDHIYTGHCTGDAAYMILREELGERISQFESGFCVETDDDR